MKKPAYLVSLFISGIAALALIATPTGATSNGPPGKNTTNERGDRIWFGEASERLKEVAEIVDDTVGHREDVFAGTALTSDRSMIEIYATPAAKTHIAAMRQDIGQDFDSLVRVIEVEHSMDTLLAAQSRLLDSNELPKTISSVDPDIVNNGLMLATTPDPNSAPRSAQSLPSVSAAPSPGGPKIKTRVRPGGINESAGTRLNDYPRFYGGSAISGPARCSLGFPVTLNGKKYAVTAGHCDSGRFFNPGSGTFVGGTWTTTWPGTASRYGDWQLLSGSTYATRLYSDSVSSSASLAISRGNTGSRAIGTELCSSGQVTGSRCRYVVTQIHDSDTYSGVRVGYLTRTIHDPNRDGTGTCTGFRKGDSGGPAYYASPKHPGTVEVLGIISALPGPGYCDWNGYLFTEFKGMLAWNSGLRVQGS